MKTEHLTRKTLLLNPSDLPTIEYRHTASAPHKECHSLDQAKGENNKKRGEGSNIDLNKVQKVGPQEPPSAEKNKR
jgi:hypothetical protein